MIVPFVDLKSQLRPIRKESDADLRNLMKRGDFILGKDVREFEEEFSAYLSAKHALGVNSGTDALFLGLLGLGVGPGDEVLVPAYTYIASAFAVTYTGARPVFIDIDEKTYNLDPFLIERAITQKTKAIMPVHLYGQSAAMDRICALAQKFGLKIIEDAAQAHGSEFSGKKTGCWGDVGAFSFYPTKNLGAFGDAGMIITNNDQLQEKLQKLRDYGRKSRYEHVSVGFNSRLDGIQALFLRKKLKYLDSWNNMRIFAAGLYKSFLEGSQGVRLPYEDPSGKHVYHIFAVRVKNRDHVLAYLKRHGICAMVHYPVPLHLQEVYRNLGHQQGDFPVAEKVSQEILCLPIYPHIRKNQIEYVAKKLKKAVRNG